MRNYLILLSLFIYLFNIPVAAVTIPIIPAAVSSEIQGSLTEKNISVELKHLYVSKEEDGFGKRGLVILMTDKPLSAKDSSKEFHELFLRETNSIRVTFTPSPESLADITKINSIHFFTWLNGGQYQGSTNSSFDPAQVTFSQLDDKKLVASFSVKKDGFALHADINAPVRNIPAPLTQEQLDEIQRSVLGQSAQAFIKAILSGNKAAIKKTITTASHAEIDKPEADEHLKMMREVLTTKMTFKEVKAVGQDMVRVVLVRPDMKGFSKPLMLQQENKQWKVALISPR